MFFLFTTQLAARRELSLELSNTLLQLTQEHIPFVNGLDKL
jgi:hypothetical protein